MHIEGREIRIKKAVRKERLLKKLNKKLSKSQKESKPQNRKETRENRKKKKPNKIIIKEEKEKKKDSIKSENSEEQFAEEKFLKMRKREANEDVEMKNIRKLPNKKKRQFKDFIKKEGLERLVQREDKKLQQQHVSLNERRKKRVLKKNQNLVRANKRKIKIKKIA